MRIKSTGKCAYCDGVFSRQAMGRHLATCRGKQAELAPAPQRRAATAKVFHLFVEGDGLPEYWMHLEAPARITLKDFDAFLRRTWLECCGHLSAFTIDGRRFNHVQFDDEREDFFRNTFVGVPKDRDMNVALADALRAGLRFEHEYDFGSTTALKLKVVAEYESAVKGKSIKVLSRNDPPPISCGSCEQFATQICSMCMSEEEGWLCDECAASHDCEEDYFLPLVNSPRAGVCGYEG
ncbi:MAG: IS1096 element passenger TnpR family protein [Pyrinomonadaceae bacterium]